MWIEDQGNKLSWYCLRTELRIWAWMEACCWRGWSLGFGAVGLKGARGGDKPDDHQRDVLSKGTRLNRSLSLAEGMRWQIVEGRDPHGYIPMGFPCYFFLIYSMSFTWKIMKKMNFWQLFVGFLWYNREKNIILTFLNERCHTNFVLFIGS